MNSGHLKLQSSRPKLKHRRWTILAAALLLFGMGTGCRRDMYNQPKGDPLKPDTFFADGSVSRLLVSNTVARSDLRIDPVFFEGKVGTNLVTAFPIAIDESVLLRGQQRYEIYCSPCHGRTGRGNGMVVQRGFPAPPSYHVERLRKAPVGHFYDVPTRGYGIMYSYAQRVEPVDRWAIAAYIKALQLREHATLQDVDHAEREKLESSLSQKRGDREIR